MTREPEEVPPPDLHGRVALVTGGSGGVGLEIVRALAGAGATVLMPVRDAQRGARAVEAVRRTVPDAALEVRELDLARLDSVRALVAQLGEEEPAIDLFVMNAGIVLLGDRKRHTSPDGVELHLATNFLGHFALTTGILPLLRSTGARIAVQCSGISRFAGIHWDDVQCERRYSALRAYAGSKVALGLFGTELARRSAASGWGLTVPLCHPGVAPDTGIAGPVRERLGGGPLHRLVRRIGNTPRQAAQPALLALTSDAEAASFFGPAGAMQLSGAAVRQRPYRHLSDATGGARAWQLGLRLSGCGAPDADTMP